MLKVIYSFYTLLNSYFCSALHFIIYNISKETLILRKMQTSLSPQILTDAINAARQGQSQAYCPYSKFRVGAAVVTTDGQIFKGCNVENATYHATICAERTAVASAVANGHRKYKACVVCTDIIDAFKWPCGQCRQFLMEFGDCEIISVKPDGSQCVSQLSVLLPKAFGPSSLEEKRVGQ